MTSPSPWENAMLNMKAKAAVGYGLLGFILVFFLLTHTANVEYDSPSYIHFDVSRPMLYPLFIWLFRWAANYQFTVIMWTQALLLVCALAYARCWLVKNLALSDFTIFLIFLWVLFTISFHYQVWYIQSEGLAFPLFIMVFFLLVECFYQYHFKRICLLAFFVSLLILTRLQFYYFYGMFIVLVLWYTWQKIPKKSLIAAWLILSLSVVLTQAIDHTYHKVMHGRLANVSYAYTGPLVLVQTLLLANNNAENYFVNNAQEKAIVSAILTQRNLAHLNPPDLQSFRPSSLQNVYQDYSKNFIVLLNIIQQELNIHSTSVEKNQFVKDINSTLIKHETKKNLLFFVWKWIECIGNFPLFLFFLIVFITSTTIIIKNKLYYPAVSTIFIWLVAVITFLNAMMIALCNPDLPCYFCYSQFILYCTAGYLASHPKKLGTCNDDTL